MAFIPASRLEPEWHLLDPVVGLSIDKDYFFTQLPNGCYRVHDADVDIVPLENEGTTYGAIITIEKGGPLMKVALVPPVQGTYLTNVEATTSFMDNMMEHRDVIFVSKTMCPGDVNYDAVHEEWSRQKEYG
jgi:hypothetical protein